MSEKELDRLMWITIRRALLMMAAAIAARFGLDGKVDKA